AGPRSNDRIAVEIVLIVEAGQRILASGLLELREAVRQRRPDDGIEIAVIDLEIEAARLEQGRHAAGIALAFGAKGQPIDILEIGQRLDRLLRLEIVLVAEQGVIGTGI